MKKYLIILFLLFLSASAFGQSAPKVLVVYYSRDGHTKLVAEKLAEKFKGTLERLIDEKNRKGLIATTIAGKDAIAKNLTRIKPIKADPEDFDIILVGTPGWFSNMTPAVRTFLVQNDISDKKVGVFGTAHLSGIDNAAKQIADLISPEDNAKIPRLPLLHADLAEDVLKSKIGQFYKEVLSINSK